LLNVANFVKIDTAINKRVYTSSIFRHRDRDLGQATAVQLTDVFKVQQSIIVGTGNFEREIHISS
jgi:hypothetical protein